VERAAAEDRLARRLARGAEVPEAWAAPRLVGAAAPRVARAPGSPGAAALAAREVVRR
jgi:hypothetical protein